MKLKLLCSALMIALTIAGYFADLSRRKLAAAQKQNDSLLIRERVAQQKIDSLRDGMAKRDKEFDQARKSLESEIAAAKTRTPAEAAKSISDLANLPDLPRVIEGQTPDAPSALMIPSTDIVPLNARLATCRLREMELGKCQADINDLNAIVVQLEDKNAAASKRADTWQAVQGVSRRSRLWYASRVAGCAAGAVLASRAAGANTFSTTMVTTAVTATCSLLK